MPDVGSITTILRPVSFSHGPGTTEQDLVEHLSLTESIEHHFSFLNLSQVNITTVRVFEKLDGITYSKLSTRIFPTQYPDAEAVIITLNGGGNDMKITLQSSVDEGSAKAIDGNTRDTIRL